MRQRKIFSDAISNLKSEELRSEFQRSYLLIILFSAILVTAALNFYFLNDTMVEFYGGSSTFFILVGFVGIFLLYQFLVLLYFKEKMKANQSTSTAYKVIHTMIEISFPTAIIFYMMEERQMLSFIDSPIGITYFLFIILSILHLDFKVNIFAGLFASAQYIFLTYYAFNHVEFNEMYSTMTPENSHYIRAVVLILSGGAAAFVSAKLKKE
jgi:adenylate cyclase